MKSDEFSSRNFCNCLQWGRRGPALGGPGSPDFTFHVFHVLFCVRRTSKTTVRSPSVMAPSRASISLLGFVGSGRWHCSREPRVLPAHNTPYAVVSSRGLLQGRSVLPLCATRLLHVRVRCRPTSDSVLSPAVAGFMSICLPPPIANGGLAAPARGCMVHASAGKYDGV